MPTTTAESLATWATRHERAGLDWAARYWASHEAPHRAVLEAAWGTAAPRTVLELGANAGPNLRRAARRWPQAHLTACDVNPMALAFLQRAARADGWAHRLTIRHGDLRAVLPTLGDRSVDLVFTVYTLAYLAPEDLAPVCRELRRVTAQRLVLMEPMTAGPSTWLGQILPSVTPPGWAHDYRGPFCAAPGRLTLDPFNGPDGLTGILTWEVADP